MINKLRDLRPVSLASLFVEFQEHDLELLDTIE
jgi:hypothetical protein